MLQQMIVIADFGGGIYFCTISGMFAFPKLNFDLNQFGRRRRPTSGILATGLSSHGLRPKSIRKKKRRRRRGYNPTGPWSSFKTLVKTP